VYAPSFYMLEEGYIVEKRNPVLSINFMRESKVIIKTFDDNKIKEFIYLIKRGYSMKL
jgi:integrase/recombinase XerD